jgi:hypothetical protein
MAPWEPAASASCMPSSSSTTTQMLTTAARHTSAWLPEGYMQNFRQAA